jgi:hypothetical protein
MSSNPPGGDDNERLKNLERELQKMSIDPTGLRNKSNQEIRNIETWVKTPSNPRYEKLIENNPRKAALAIQNRYPRKNNILGALNKSVIEESLNPSSTIQRSLYFSARGKSAKNIRKEKRQNNTWTRRSRPTDTAEEMENTSGQSGNNWGYGTNTSGLFNYPNEWNFGTSNQQQQQQQQPNFSVSPFGIQGYAQAEEGYDQQQEDIDNELYDLLDTHLVSTVGEKMSADQQEIEAKVSGLLQQGANPFNTNFSNGNSPFMRACCQGWMDPIDQIREINGDEIFASNINVRNRRGWSALTCALSTADSRPYIARFLLELSPRYRINVEDIDVKFCNNKDRLLGQVITDKDLCAKVKALYESGSNLDAAEEEGANYMVEDRFRGSEIPTIHTEYSILKERAAKEANISPVSINQMFRQDTSADKINTKQFLVDAITRAVDDRRKVMSVNSNSSNNSNSNSISAASSSLVQEAPGGPYSSGSLLETVGSFFGNSSPVSSPVSSRSSSLSEASPYGDIPLGVAAGGIPPEVAAAARAIGFPLTSTTTKSELESFYTSKNNPYTVLKDKVINPNTGNNYTEKEIDDLADIVEEYLTPEKGGKRRTRKTRKIRSKKVKKSRVQRNNKSKRFIKRRR